MVIDDALTAIERENERRKGFRPKNFARQELDKRRLGDVVDLFTNIESHDAGEWCAFESEWRRGTDSPKPVLASM